jgi:porin
MRLFTLFKRPDLRAYLLIVSMGWTGSLFGQTPSADSAAAESWSHNLLQAERLTGDWGGSRTYLEEHGVRFSIYYNHYYAHKDNGGKVEKSDGAHSGSVDLIGQFNLEKLNLIPGGAILVHAKTLYSDSINDDVGALGNPIDDADGDRGPYIAQLYYQQSLADRKFEFRVGYLDQQTMLDRNAFANSEDKQFMNTYLDNNNAIIPLAVGPGIAVFFNPSRHLSFVLGTANAQSKPYQASFDTLFNGDWDYYGYFETDLHYRTPFPHDALPGNFRIGLFFDPRDKTEFDSDPADPDISHDDIGFYLTADQMMYLEPESLDEGLGIFVRYGWREGKINKIEQFYSAGLQYRGLLPSRDDDKLGVAFYAALGSDEYQDGVDSDFDKETGYEAYYLFQLTPALTVTPAVQYLSQPGALTSRSDALIGALRVRFSF